MGHHATKRLLALVLSVLMLLGSAVIPALAAETGDESGQSTGYKRKTLKELSEAFNTISYEEYRIGLTEHYDVVAELSRLTGKTETEIAAMKLRDRNQLIKDYIGEMNKQPRTGETITVDVTSYLTGEATTAEGITTLTYTDDTGVTKNALVIPDSGMITWPVQVKKSGLYALRLVYCSSSDKKNSIERNLYVNGAIPFTEARGMQLTKTWVTGIENLTRVDSVAGKKDEASLAQYCILGDDGNYYRFATDSSGNELKPNMYVEAKWTEYEFVDADGMYTVPFEFYLEEGTNTFSMRAVREGMYLASIEFYTLEDRETYADYSKDNAGKNAGSDKILIQAELPSAVSNYTIYPIYDRSSAIVQPQHPTSIMRNAIGASKWENPGQWVEYTFTVETAGLYSFGLAFRQNQLAGIYASRLFYLDGVIPFDEAAALRFEYSEDWQCDYLGDENGNPFEFYLEPGEHTIRFVATTGSLGSIINYVEEIQESLNSSYLEILKLTGTEPDQYRDYGFMRIMPNTIRNLLIQRDNLKAVLNQLSGERGLSANTVIFQQLITLLNRMGSDQNQIAKSLSELKSELGTLGEWCNSVKIQPLELDYILIQNKSEKLPKATPGFFESFGFQMSQFFGSFTADYNSLGTGTGEEVNASVEVWVQSGRDQAQITRSIIQNEYRGAVVNLKLVADGTLLPAVLSGTGPDVSLDGVKASASLSQAMGTTVGVSTSTMSTMSNGSGDVVNYAIRNAIEPLNGFTREFLDEDPVYSDVPSFTDVTPRFSPSALTPLTLYGTTYALPNKQTWPMMFVRSDILTDLGAEIPETWDELMALLPVLQYNNMTIGLTTDYAIYLYQMGSKLWADDGMRINLDSNEALAAFTKMCDMFTQYSLPYNYNPSNRFRTGEMPIFIAEYETFYNTLVVFATEISGVWSLAPIPGTVDADGNINHVSVSTVTGVVMLRAAKEKRAAWQFMTWYTDKDFQVEYSNELIAVVGPAAKNATANMAALEELDWTHDEYEALYDQMNNLVAVEAYPGSYIIFRYTNFAFLDAYNEGERPADALLGNVTAINKEITRKRKEFDLETLATGQTLATKRLGQASDLIAGLSDSEKSPIADELKAATKAIEEKNGEKIAEAARAIAAKIKASGGYLVDPENGELKASYAALDASNEPMWEFTVLSDNSKIVSGDSRYSVYLLCQFLFDASRRLN